jgi:iron complex transport system substrate-binding protein
MDSQEKKIVFALTLAAFAIAWLVHACGEHLSKRARVGNSKTASSQGNVSKETVVSYETSPQKIVVFSPAAVQIIFALGAGSRVVGATRFATFPPAATKLPDLGGIIDVNYEQLTALNPDLIIVQASSERLAKFAQKRGIAFLQLSIETIEDVFHACGILSRRLGCSEQGAMLIERVKRELARVKNRLEGVERTRCFLSVDRRPRELTGLLTAGRRTFISQIIEIAGGRNVFDDLELGYVVVSKEALLVRTPNVVLELKPGAGLSSKEHLALITDWKELPGLSAVKNSRIHVIDHDAALMPGPRMGEVANQIAALLHPELFSSVREDMTKGE